MILATTAFFFALFALIGSINSFLEYLNHNSKQMYIQDKKRLKMIEKKGIERACRKSLKFLNKDGSINVLEAKKHIAKIKEKERMQPETINFQIIE